MHNMGDSEDSEIDVCSVDDEIASTNTGLTLVAAETYVPHTNNCEEQLIPLTKDDLLTSSKLKSLQGKSRFSRNHSAFKKSNQKENIVEEEDKKEDESQLNVRKHKVECTAADDGFVEAKVSCQIETLQSDSTDSNEKPVNPNHVNKLFSSDDIKKEDSESDEESVDRGLNEPLNRFHFESDHLAIKNNSDYHALLQVLTVLEAQRTQAIKDLERLHVLKDEAINDPLKFVQDLRDRKSSDFPERQVVPTLPEVNWVHYMMAYSGDRYIPQITTRKAVKTQETDITSEINDTDGWDDNSLDGTHGDSFSKFKSRIDGKPASHKQKWSIEEQEKLEKLLLLYPPEEIEARRWEKIAKGLGTRTPQQVSSRIQKYFLKLAKAKLPIPGRGPTGTMLNQCKKSKMNPINYKNSSFFPSWRPSVYMSENDKDDIGGQYLDEKEDFPVSDDEETLPDGLKQTSEYQELIQLKKIKKYRTSKQEDKAKPALHKGFMCDGCKMDPIVGVRWHCMQCPPDQSTDFCNNCSQRPFKSEIHTSEHHLVPVDKAVETDLDNDYLAFEQRNKFKYNYLDPNFIPSG